MHHGSISNDAQVAALPGDSRLAQRDNVIFGGHFIFDAAVQVFVLEENYGVVVADGSLDETFRVISSRGTDHFQTRSMHEVHFGILRMKGTAMDIAPAGAANHERRRRAPAVVSLGHHIHDLVEGTTNEVHELKFRNRTHTR